MAVCYIDGFVFYVDKNSKTEEGEVLLETQPKILMITTENIPHKPFEQTQETKVQLVHTLNYNFKIFLLV